MSIVNGGTLFAFEKNTALILHHHFSCSWVEWKVSVVHIKYTFILNFLAAQVPVVEAFSSGYLFRGQLVDCMACSLCIWSRPQASKWCYIQLCWIRMRKYYTFLLHRSKGPFSSLKRKASLTKICFIVTIQSKWVSPLSFTKPWSFLMVCSWVARNDLGSFSSEVASPLMCWDFIPNSFFLVCLSSDNPFCRLPYNVNCDRAHSFQWNNLLVILLLSFSIILKIYILILNFKVVWYWVPLSDSSISRYL